MIIIITEILLYIYSAIVMLWIIYLLRRTIRLFNHVPFVEMKQMLRFASRTRNIYFIYLAILGSGLTILIVWMGSFFDIPLYPPSLVIAILITSLFTFVKIGQPPAVVLLTSSSPDSAYLLERINLVISPLKAIALLEYARLHPLQRFDSYNNLRVTNPQVWKSLVHQLLEITLIVVIDTRGKGPGLVEEIFIMLAPERVRKAVFISEPDGSCPALATYGINPRKHALKVCTEKSLLPLLVKMTESPHRLPWPIESNQQHTSQSILPENLDTFPSMLQILIVNIFDSEDIAKDARTSEKDLVALIPPWSMMLQPNSVQQTQQRWTLLWEFVHDPQLVVIFFEPFDGAIIRTRFLVNVASQLQKYVSRIPSGRLTIEQLFEPDPIRSNIHDYIMELVSLANQQGYTFRVVKTAEL